MTALLIILIAALIFSQIFQRFHLPWVIALITAGMILGVSGFGILEVDETIGFLAQMGLIFLMFMAGLETRVSGLKHVWKQSLVIAAAAGLVPLAVGLAIGIFFGYGLAAALLLGIVFISSSIAIIIPSLEEKGILQSSLGRTIVSSIMLQDIASLVLLAVALQYLIPGAFLPFPLFAILFPLAILGGFLLAKAIPTLRWMVQLEKQKGSDFFEKELRFVFLILIAVVLVFEALGLHPIAGAFFAGLILSEAIRSKVLKGKIHVLAYGLFIPVFFVTLGAKTDLQAFIEIKGALLLLAVVLLASMVSKFLSAWVASKALGYTASQSSLVGVACIPRLSTTLAVTFVGHRLGFLAPELVASIVVLSIVSIFVTPFFMNPLLEKVKKTYLVTSVPEKNDSPENKQSS